MKRNMADGFENFLVAKGFTKIEKEILVSQKIGCWEILICYTLENGNYSRILFGWRTEKYLDVMYQAKKKAYESKYNIIKRSSLEHPMFFACSDDVACLGYDPMTVESLKKIHGSAEWAISSFSMIIYPFLQTCKDYDSCLHNLNKFSSGLPMHFPAKIVLLGLLGRHEEIIRLVNDFIESWAARSMPMDLVLAHQEFANEVLRLTGFSGFRPK